VDKKTRLGIIAIELLQNISSYEFDDIKEKSFYVSEIWELLHYLRCCYSRDEELKEFLFYSKDEIEENLAKLSGDRNIEAKHLISEFWEHPCVSRMISDGIHNEKFDVFEDIDFKITAYSYLERDWMKSESLNWILIDSLVFFETFQYARSVVPYAKSRNQSWIKYFLFPIIGEIAALTITALICLFLSNLTYPSPNADLIFWIIFTPFTLLRWLKYENKEMKLLLKMAAFQAVRLKEPYFNPELIKQMLYDLEKDGAVYNLIIYSILNKKYV
jgi:hypothetical protein